MRAVAAGHRRVVAVGAPPRLDLLAGDVSRIMEKDAEVGCGRCGVFRPSRPDRTKVGCGAPVTTILSTHAAGRQWLRNLPVQPLPAGWSRSRRTPLGKGGAMFQSGYSMRPGPRSRPAWNSDSADIVWSAVTKTSKVLSASRSKSPFFIPAQPISGTVTTSWMANSFFSFRGWHSSSGTFMRIGSIGSALSLRGQRRPDRA